jgi:hypothetical protein
MGMGVHSIEYKKTGGETIATGPRKSIVPSAL